MCVCERERERERERPVISKCEAIKHLAGISAGTIHGRHPCSLLTASILQNRIEHNLRKLSKSISHQAKLGIDNLQKLSKIVLKKMRRQIQTSFCSIKCWYMHNTNSLTIIINVKHGGYLPLTKLSRSYWRCSMKSSK